MRTINRENLINVLLCSSMNILYGQLPCSFKWTCVSVLVRYGRESGRAISFRAIPQIDGYKHTLGSSATITNCAKRFAGHNMCCAFVCPEFDSVDVRKVFDDWKGETGPGDSGQIAIIYSPTTITTLTSKIPGTTTHSQFSH